jgi:type IV secretory pathway TrbD component
MVIVIAFLIVLLFAGLGFAVHLLWIAAAIFLVLWLVGFAIGRGEGAGNHRFYRW